MVRAEMGFWVSGSGWLDLVLGGVKRRALESSSVCFSYGRSLVRVCGSCLFGGECYDSGMEWDEWDGWMGLARNGQGRGREKMGPLIRALDRICGLMRYPLRCNVAEGDGINVLLRREDRRSSETPDTGQRAAGQL